MNYNFLSKMDEFFSAIFYLIFFIILFILGYINVFSTEKTLKKLYFQRTKLQIKLDKFFNISKERPNISQMRFGGWVAMIVSIFGFIMFLVNVFKR